jgi:hypothetical protein
MMLPASYGLAKESAAINHTTALGGSQKNCFDF